VIVPGETDSQHSLHPVLAMLDGTSGPTSGQLTPFGGKSHMAYFHGQSSPGEKYVIEIRKKYYTHTGY
jgi:hypothetical protein